MTDPNNHDTNSGRQTDAGTEQTITTDQIDGNPDQQPWECPYCGHLSFRMDVNTVQRGSVSNGDFVAHETGSFITDKYDDAGREIVTCEECLRRWAIADDTLVSPLDDSVEVSADALETVLRFVRDDPALDSAPENSSVPDAIDTLIRQTDVSLDLVDRS